MSIKRSTFNLSGLHMTTFKMGQFVPVCYRNIYPGDSVFARSSTFVRLLGLNSPVIHPVYLRAYWFFIPVDITWPNWNEYINGSDFEDPHVLPTFAFDSAKMGKGSIFDKMGFAISASTDTKILAFLGRAYSMCWNWYIADQDLQTQLPVSTEDGPDTTTDFSLQNVAWEKDDFTVARPWTQKGPQIYIPLGTRAPVLTSSTATVTGAHTPLSFLKANGDGTSGSVDYTLGLQGGSGTGGGGRINRTQTATAFGADGGLYPNNLYADLESSSALTVPELRLTSALQRAEENRAMYGSRINEYLQQEFGVAPYPSELDQPVYLGGGRRTIQFSEVLGTVNNENTQIGEYGGHASGLMSSRPVKFFSREHGILLLCVAMQPGTVYNQGYPRDLLKQDRNEWIQPELVGVGAQEVLTQEIHAGAAPGTVFGYQLGRYYYERHGYNTSGGDFRDTLNTWTMTRDFASVPSLNADFIKSNPTERIFNASTYDQIVSATYAYIKVRRVLPKHAPHILK